jgi:hypothetical protein
MVTVYSDDALLHTAVFEWARRFKGEYLNINDSR